ncbi:MAG: DNA polymerase/3'-5' exonuclease PolX [bacterium]|nr:DNA polymerase/3'-5' exonuclease PolX [bacterium]
MKNHEIAVIFEHIADILELKGENIFKISAYRKASRILKDLASDIEEIDKQGKLKEIAGIGSGMTEKIEEFIKTGKIERYEEIKKEVPDGLVGLLSVPGLGPKGVSKINRELGIKNIDDLKKAISDGKLRELEGFGEKKEENILRGVEVFESSKGRINLGLAYPLVENILGYLFKIKEIKKAVPAGSLRRMQETIGDIDILVTGSNGPEIIEHFKKYPGVKEVLASGETKGSIRVEDGIQVDLRFVPEESFGSALQYFTGSKNHNIKLRDMAKKAGFKINEYGIFRDDVKLGGKKEEEIYKVLGLPFIPPEMREDRGEIEIAVKGRMPELLEHKNIRGDFHVHSRYSDGSNSLREIAETGRKMGYEYIAITDHSQSLHIAHGLKPEKLEEQIEEINTINKEITGIKLLKGSEVNIKSDGTLDLQDNLLKKLDIVIASIHSGFKEDEDMLTGRVLDAMDNPYVSIFAHPTGRLIGERDAYHINIEKVIKKAKEKNIALEINAYYTRLDLNDINSRRAKEAGVKLAIGTDAHNTEQLWMMKFGVSVARRGWLEKKDVLNTFNLKDLKNWLK